MVALEREVVDVTAVIKNILDNYPAGSAILRELLQNTDDAGASDQEFVLDTRTFPANNLVDPALAACQGPALLAYNNSYFRRKDWDALTHIQQSSKTAEEASTGKYGLGFRSCYHVTDTPHILSGEKLLILDPHNRAQDFPGGFSLRLETEDRSQFAGHFRVFESYLSNNLCEGTTIRLPLRLEAQAQISNIKKTPTSVDLIRNTFRDFVEKELPEVMLFLKNVTSIGLFEIDVEGTKTMTARAWIEDTGSELSYRNQSRGREAETSHYEITVNVEKGGVVTSRRWLLTQYVADYQAAKNILSARLQRPLGTEMADEKLVPHVALALPLPDGTASVDTAGTALQGRLFTLLPLPIITGFPAHLHSVLAVTSSRQNLRNPQDVTPGSREEFLVEWNRAIFSDFAPQAWSSMLQHIAQPTFPVITGQAFDIFKAWPTAHLASSGDQGYWQPLPAVLLALAATMAVWPVQGPGASVQHQRLTDVLVTQSPGNRDLLCVLESCGVSVTCIPANIYTLIQDSSTYHEQLMTPRRVSAFLKATSTNAFDTEPYPIERVKNLDSSSLLTLCNYLATDDDLNLLAGLPIIPTVSGTHISIDMITKYTLVTADEAAVFGEVDGNLLALDRMSERTAQLLRRAAAHVTFLQPSDVLRYLRDQTVHIDWLIRFWNWVDRWSQGHLLWSDQALRAELLGLIALPLSVTSGGFEVGLVGTSAIDPLGVDPSLLNVYHQLGLPALHQAITSRGSVVPNIIVSANDIPYILRQLSRQSSFSLHDTARQTLHSHFSVHLPIVRQPLDHQQITTLRLLPVFPILLPGQRASGNVNLEVGPVSMCPVGDSVVVVPTGKPFVDVSAGSAILDAIRKADPSTGGGTLGEGEVLGYAVENWAAQTQQEGLEELLIERILRRLGDLTDVQRGILATLPIVDVGLGGLRRSPLETIDPMSSIAPLYDPGEGWLPAGLYESSTPGSYLQQLRTYGMMRPGLSGPIIVERITRIIDTVTPLVARETKALKLLELLDIHSSQNNIPSDALSVILEEPWLPAGSEAWCRPSRCWDRKDALLCDLVLPLVKAEVTSDTLRTIFGWKDLPFQVLQNQFVAVVAGEAVNNMPSPTISVADRITLLVRRLAHNLHKGFVSDAELANLTDALGDDPWVPLSDGRCMPSRRVVLQTLDLGSRFYQVSYSLLADRSDRLVPNLLQKMGVLDRPSTASLYEELKAISVEIEQVGLDELSKDGLVASTLPLLTELSRRLVSSNLNRARTLVPSMSFTLWSVDSVVYDDLGSGLADTPPEYELVHPSVSHALANRLGILRLSDSRFSLDADQLDGFDIGEDLSTRINGVLKDYDVAYASNEWIANADDANATTVSFLLDEAVFEGPKILGPQLSELQRCRALVIHNSGVFVDRDFDGLKNVGIGGKGDTHETIGRFGLGALSLYHFTDMPMVVSAGSVLFLDPSLRYLPRIRGQSKTGVIMSIDFCRMKYPDQLKPIEGLFGFSMDQSFYSGTIFRLPLRSAQQAKESKLSQNSFDVQDLQRMTERFYHLSTQSLFFTKIENVSAFRRGPDPRRQEMVLAWSVEATRRGVETPSELAVIDKEVALKLSPKGLGPGVTERWLVSTQIDELPERFHPLIQPHRLPSPSVGISVRLESTAHGPTAGTQESRLFATLPLPITVSIPVHIHSTWILAPDRRSLRFDAPNLQGHRPLDTQYNIYLLERLLSPLYLRVIATVAAQYPAVFQRCWPSNPADPIAHTLTDALYTQFVGTPHAVCRTVTDILMPPSQAIFHTSRSASVAGVLSGLKIPHYLNKLPFNKAMVDWSNLTVDDPPTLARILRERSPAVKDVISLGISQDRPAGDLDGVLSYLVKAGENLVGLPLLQLGTGEITEFLGSEGRPVFASSRSEIAKLFGKDRVMGRATSPATIGLLMAGNSNVCKLDVRRLRNLLGERGIVPASRQEIDSLQGRWLQRLLVYLATGRTVKLTEVSDLPLIPTKNLGLAISLDLYNQSGVINSGSLLYSPHICPTLLALGIPIVDGVLSVPSKPFLDLSGLLDATRSLDRDSKSLHHTVASSDWSHLATWIRSQLPRYPMALLSPGNVSVLSNLALFEARRGRITAEVTLSPASDVLMLPTGVNLVASVRYLPDALFAPHSRELEILLGAIPHQTLSYDQCFRRLLLPARVEATEEIDYRHVLQMFISYHKGHYGGALVPDQQRILRQPIELYDHRVQLFRTVLQGRSEKFVHPGFHILMDGLVRLGVRSQVEARDLVVCAKAVDYDARRGATVADKSEVLWNHFNNWNLAQHVSLRTIADLRFIPTSPRRHPHVRDFDRFARPLPIDVVALNEIMTVEHAPILWTQRAQFTTLPPSFICAELKSPNAAEVVHHLFVLATEVAKAHPSDRSLLSDLTATYTWLSNHQKAARQSLSQLSHSALWLNVNDPRSEPWVWRSAKQLVYDLPYNDEGGKFYDAKEFLHPQKSLLLVVGAHQYRRPNLPATRLVSNGSHSGDLLVGLDELRRQGSLTDIHMTVAGETIAAHRAVLASVVPYFRNMFNGGFLEGRSNASNLEPMIYPLPSNVTASSVRILIEYVYRGKFDNPTSEDIHDAEKALIDLLNVLELANMWDMDVLRSQAELAIVELQLVQVSNCDEILHRAEEVRALGLVEVCKETKRINNWST